VEVKLETIPAFAQACGVEGNAPKQILVVDDEVPVLRLVREALANSFFCEVDTSPKPEYGFELALKKTYDLMIFDFSMPLMDGTMLFLLVSKAYENMSPPRKMPPLILVSGQGGDARAQELLKEPGVRGFLPKPFTINRLLQKVKECVPSLEPVTPAQ
jgi:CheY-like chemotaxis protein